MLNLQVIGVSCHVRPAVIHFDPTENLRHSTQITSYSSMIATSCVDDYQHSAEKVVSIKRNRLSVFGLHPLACLSVDAAIHCSAAFKCRWQSPRREHGRSDCADRLCDVLRLDGQAARCSAAAVSDDEWKRCISRRGNCTTRCTNTQRAIRMSNQLSYSLLFAARPFFYDLALFFCVRPGYVVQTLTAPFTQCLQILQPCADSHRREMRLSCLKAGLPVQ